MLVRSNDHQINRKASFYLAARAALLLKVSPILSQAPSVRERLEREASVLTFQHSDWARAGLVFEQVVVLVIVSNVAAFALSTEERIMANFPHLQTVVISIEWITVAFFTVEYILRLITCGVHDQHRGFVG